MAAFKQYVELRSHKKQKTLISMQIYDLNCQKYAFNLFVQVCQDRIEERKKREIAKKHHYDKVIQKYFIAVSEHRMQRKGERLNQNIADEFRFKVLARGFLLNIQMNNQIFRDIYSDEKMDEIWRSNLMGRTLKRLKIYSDVRKVDMDQLPQSLSYYLVADIWT